MTPEPLVPVHPETVAEDTRALRWRTPVGLLGFVGPVGTLPPALQALCDDGTVASISVEPAAVLIRLSGEDWAAQGARVRTALQTALAAPGDWRPAAGGGSADDVLRMAVGEVIAGEVGSYVRSHGGEVTLLGVQDGEVEVSLSGACRHCPASDITLTDRFEVALRELYPQVRTVTARTDPGPAGDRRLLSLTPLRRRAGGH